MSPAHTASARARPHAPRARALALASAVCTGALAFGLARRGELELTPREGAGYWLGVAGLGCMLALLLYSLRKRARALHGAGPIRHWFEVHMILGLCGPTAVLHHAGFRADSANGAIALGAMLVVAISGVIGRFVYVRVHVGLFGRRETFSEVASSEAASRRAIHDALQSVPEALATLRSYEAAVLGDDGSVLARIPTLGVRAWRVHRRVRRALRRFGAAPALLFEASRHVELVRRLAGFAFYERVLGLWHLLHLPLCVVLFVAAALHVLAVHRY